MSEEIIRQQFEEIVEESRQEDVYEYYIKLRNMLDLYNREKEKNQVIEVFRKDLPENVNIVCMIRDDFERNFDFVSKDKIREKIEDLEGILDLLENEKNYPKYKKQDLIEEINDFKELLEE